MNTYQANFIIKNFTSMHNYEMAKILNVSLPCVDNVIRRLKNQGKLPEVKPSVLLEQMKDLPLNKGERNDLILSFEKKGFSYEAIVKLLKVYRPDLPPISRQRAEQICKKDEKEKKEN